MSKKRGLYAQYENLSGTLVTTKVMEASDAYKSNKDSNSYFWDLITNNSSLIYDYPQDEIPKVSPNFDEDSWKKRSPDYIECELCDEYYTEKEMDHISDGGPACSVCKNCAENYE